MTPAERPAAPVAGPESGRDGEDEDESVWPRGLGTGLLIVALAALLAVVYVLGARVPDKGVFVSTDVLGPESGESAAEYRDRADRSLTERQDPDEPRWALLTLAAPSTAAQAADAAGPVRISQVVFAPQVEGAPPGAVPLLTVALAAPSPATTATELIILAESAAAQRLRLDDTVSGAEAVRGAAAAELDGTCGCVTALVVRGTPAELQAQADRPEVAAIEALPADAVYGRFAVRPGPVGTD